jgi:hypothetical protein
MVMSSQAMTDGTCGAVKSSDWNSPNDYIARLNGACMPFSGPQCPYRCKQYYMNMLMESIKKLVEDLYAENLIDLETMEKEILSLKNEKNAEMIDQVLEKIKNLKE